METVKLNIAGREYPLRAPASEVDNLQRAAQAINAQFDAFKAQFKVEDPVDLLAMTALHLASENQSKHDQPATNAAFNLPPEALNQIAELNSRMERLLAI